MLRRYVRILYRIIKHSLAQTCVEIRCDWERASKTGSELTFLFFGVLFGLF